MQNRRRSVIVALEYLNLEWVGKPPVISPPCCESSFLSGRLILTICESIYSRGPQLVLICRSVFDIFETFSSGFLSRIYVNLILLMSILSKNVLTDISSFPHSGVLLASPSSSQPGLPSSLPLPHPWFSWHCSSGEPPDIAQWLHHLPADAPVACRCCHCCSTLWPSQGPHSTRSASTSPVLHSSTGYLFLSCFENILPTEHVSFNHIAAK